jgi:cell division protein FtsB
VTIILAVLVVGLIAVNVWYHVRFGQQAMAHAATQAQTDTTLARLHDTQDALATRITHLNDQHNRYIAALRTDLFATQADLIQIRERVDQLAATHTNRDAVVVADIQRVRDQIVRQNIDVAARLAELDARYAEATISLKSDLLETYGRQKILGGEMITLTDHVEGLVAFFNSLPPQSAMRAGSSKKVYRMRLPDRQKLDLR